MNKERNRRLDLKRLTAFAREFTALCQEYGVCVTTPDDDTEFVLRLEEKEHNFSVDTGPRGTDKWILSLW